MNDSAMLYKCPGPHEIHCGNYDYQIVPETDVEQALAEGWYLTTGEAKAAHEAAQQPAAAPIDPPAEVALVEPEPPKLILMVDDVPDNAPPTRAELEAKARELGMNVHHRTSDRTLAAAIDQALSGQG